jgi:hypothetical protein
MLRFKRSRFCVLCGKVTEFDWEKSGLRVPRITHPAMSATTTADSSAALRNDNKKNRQRHYEGTGNDTTKEQATA